MKIRIFLSFLLISVLGAGAFEIESVRADDLKLTLENEVAGITPDMEILPAEKGMLKASGNPHLMASPGSYSYLKKEPDKQRESYVTSRPKITSEAKFANAGFIVSDSVPVGSVIKLFELKLGTSGPDQVIVDIGKRQGIEIGDRFTAYSLGRYIYHPVIPGRGKEKLDAYTRRTGFGTEKLLSHPGKPLGNVVVIQGVLEITEPGDEVSYARVVKAYEYIEPGHLLAPYQKFEDQTSEFPATEKSINGYIVATKGDRIGIKSDDIVYIDKGWEDDVRPGDQFEVFSIINLEEKIWNQVETKKTPLLPRVLGKIKVVATQKNTATAIVVKSAYDMEVGHQIRFKSSNHPG